MLLLDLPTELLGEIAGNLAHPREQASLAALARANKLLNTLCTPLLNSAPSLTSAKQLGAFVRTAKMSWTDKTGDEAVQIKKFPLPAERCGICKQTDHGSKDHNKVLPRLVPRILHFFNSLRVLSVIHCDAASALVARLLGPLGPLRRTIESFTFVRAGAGQDMANQFLLEWLRFNHTSAVYNSEGQLLAPSEQNDHRLCTAAVSWDACAELDIIVDWTDETERLYLESPPSAHPFSALINFRLSITSDTGDEIFLVFLTGAFPSLRHLTIEGYFAAWVLVPSECFFLRRSVHRSWAPFQATFLPPFLIGQIPPAAKLAALWLPLSQQEVTSSAFSTYRGPTLDILDLSALTLYLV